MLLSGIIRPCGRVVQHVSLRRASILSTEKLEATVEDKTGALVISLFVIIIFHPESVDGGSCIGCPLPRIVLQCSTEPPVMHWWCSYSEANYRNSALL